MFGFGAKKPQPARKPRQPRDNNLAQLGLLGMGYDDPTNSVAGDDDDDDLDAELAVLMQGKAPRPKKPAPKVIPAAELDAMVQSSLREYKSDDEVSDIDDNEVEDELNELCMDDPEEPEAPVATAPKTSAGSQTGLLAERLKMYQEAEKNAKAAGDTSKARRFGRGVKTLQDLLKAAQVGKPVDENDIPPALAPSTQTKAEAPTPTPAATRPPPPPPRAAEAAPPPAAPPAAASPPPQPAAAAAASAELEEAVKRRNDYKQAALQAKRAGDQKNALQYVRMVKACEQLISQAQQSQLVDWSLLPPPPGSLQLDSPPEAPAPVKPSPDVPAQSPAAAPDAAAPAAEAAAAEALAEVSKALFDVPPPPRSTMEALEQRLKKYESSQAQAQTEGNSSKARRLGRIVKQYQDAIKMHRAGKPVPFDELPTPPGFPPIPGAPQRPEAAAVEVISPIAPAAPIETVVAAAAAPAEPAEAVEEAPPRPAKAAAPSRFDKQMNALLERQAMFKQAALEAKKAGDLNQAKECLRMAKGIDPLISAAKSGLPVDMSTLPIPPQMKNKILSGKTSGNNGKPEDGFEVISSEECALAPSLDQKDANLFQQLEADLIAQLKVCTENRDNYKAMGDLANANRFDQMALFTRKDLDLVRSAAVRGDPLPRWKNEMRTFSIVKCYTDLNDDDMEITILKGISYNVSNPKTVDTYVRFEVPIPHQEPLFFCFWICKDNPSKDRTPTVKDTNSPEYNQTFNVPINRQSRTLLRIFKTKAAKFEVWAKGGFLRSDVLIGSCSVKLAHLLNHSEYHEALDLMEGRKQVGGKVEIRIRLRDPIVGKEVEQIQQKWTVLLQ